MKFSFKRDGFSLMEIMISLGVLATITGVTAPLAIRTMEVSDISASLTEMGEINDALLMYQRDTGTFPPDNRLIYILEQPPLPLGVNWSGPYLSGNPEHLVADAWGEPYRYLASPKINGEDTKDNNRSLLLSTGRNRVENWTIAGPPDDYTNLGNEDDLFLIISAVQTKRDYEQETKDRLRVVMQRLIEQHDSFSFTELDNGTKTLNDFSAISDCLSRFHSEDQWGSPFVWHQELNLFFSIGPNRTNESAGTTLGGDDIGGS